MNWNTNELIDHIQNDEGLYRIAARLFCQYKLAFQPLATKLELTDIDWKAVKEHFEIGDK